MISNPASLTIKMPCIGICDGSQNAKPDYPAVKCTHCDATAPAPKLSHDQALVVAQTIEAEYQAEHDRLQRLIVDAKTLHTKQMRALQKMCLHEKCFQSCVQYEAGETICHACRGTVR